MFTVIGMAKKKALAIWFCCNIMLTLYIVMRNHDLRRKLKEEERIASEQAEQFQRRTLIMIKTGMYQSIILISSTRK